MNKLEQITNELLEAGYTIEEIIAAYNKVIKASKQTEADDKTNS
ncbi:MULTISPECIES: hypothetical protein [Lysinibacillus]|nr:MULTISPECIES: hypothetical protein [Lysinibacillus]